jgi:hypothetical protein
VNRSRRVELLGFWHTFTDWPLLVAAESLLPSRPRPSRQEEEDNPKTYLVVILEQNPGRLCQLGSFSVGIDTFFKENFFLMM